MTGLSTHGGMRSRISSVAVLFAVALVAASCGAAEIRTAGQTSADAAPAEGSHQFGATLDEFQGAIVEDVEATPPPEGYQEIDWEDLVPAGYSREDISARFDERMAGVEPGSPEADEILVELQNEYGDQPVNPELAGNGVQLAGFVAPLTYSGDLITEFLLVPYFGACIHVPPPPVNQTVLVSLQDGQGITIEESYGPVWVVGTLTVDGVDTDIGSAGYTINSAETGVYDDY